MLLRHGADRRHALGPLVSSQGLSPQQILILTEKVCKAVLYAHLHAVIHRDLKPSNILVGADGQPHVLDFGLAKALLDEEGAVTVSIEGQIAGTPAYMSPEQAAGHRDQIDTRTDVFSLGVILYELLTGRPPHDRSGSVIDLLRHIAEDEVPRPRTIHKSIDSELEAILLKALAKDPEDRYASAGALGKDIHSYLNQEPLDARAPTTWYFLRTKALKYRKQVALSAAVLIVVLVAFLSAYTKVVADRAILHAAQERNRLLETELVDLRAQILSGNPQEMEAALSALEDRLLASQERVQQLQQALNDGVRPAGPTVADTGFFFGEPVNLGTPINTPAEDGAAKVSSDGLEMYFGSTRTGGDARDIWVARRATRQDPWGTPVNLGAPINSPSEDIMPCLSYDGLALYFASDRPGGQGDRDLYVIERATTEAPWSEPQNLGPAVNGPGPDCDPSVSYDGLTLYFSSRRDGGYGDLDLWLTTRTSPEEPWSEPMNLGAVVNSSSKDMMPCISRDGLLLLFCSRRPGGYGHDDIFLSRRSTPDQPWSEPVNLGPMVNGPDEDSLPFFAVSDSTLFFNSTRPGGIGFRDIWQVPMLPAREFTFGHAVNLGSRINSPAEDRGPCVSADGLELYFDSRRAGGLGQWDIWLLTRTTVRSAWGEPANLGAVVNSASWDAQPYVSGDGLSLFFASGRPGGSGGDDLWMATRPTKEDEWAGPVNLGPNLNSPRNDISPCLSDDGLSLYFASNRNGGYGGFDMYVSTRAAASQPWGEPVNLGPVLNTASGEDFPRILPDGLTLFFQCDRNGGYGEEDIWMTKRKSAGDSWGPPVNLGPLVNSPDFDIVPSLSRHDSTLVFSSNRSGGSGGDDLWQAPMLTNIGFAFGEPAGLGSPINSEWSEVGPSLSYDGLSLYFSDYTTDVRPGGQGGADLWVSHRATTEQPWGEAVNLGPVVNSDAHDMEPSVSADELSLYFCSDRPGGYGRMDLWVARRASTGKPWSAPVNLGPIINSKSDDTEPCISADGLFLYFDSHRHRPNDPEDRDLWVARRSSEEDAWGPPVNLGPTVNSPFEERGPSVSADGLALFFLSARPEAPRHNYLWVTTRPALSAAWSTPVPIGPMLPYPDWVACAGISPDATTLYFKAGAADDGDDFDIWQVSIVPKVDLNGDHAVDIEDLEMLIQHWGRGRSPADIAPAPFGDGQVDEQDLRLLVERWSGALSEDG